MRLDLRASLPVLEVSVSENIEADKKEKVSLTANKHGRPGAPVLLSD